MRRALVLVAAAACSKESPTPRHELHFRGEAKVVAAAPGGGAVVAGGFAVKTDLGAGELEAGDDKVHGVVARIGHDGRVAWDAVLGGPFVDGVAADGDAVMLVAAAMPENRAWRLGPGGGEQWSVSFGGAYPRASAWSDAGTLYVVGELGSGDSGALALAPQGGRTSWIAAIDRGGKVRWAKLLEPAAGQRFVMGVAIAGERVFVISTAQSDLIVDAYDRAGARVATRTLPVDGMNASISSLGDGVVIAARFGLLLALDRSLASRWERQLALGIDVGAIDTGPDGIFIGGNAQELEWNGVTYPPPADTSSYAYVARLTLDGDPDWISIGRGTGAASTRAIAASGDVVWAVGVFDGPFVFGHAAPLRGEPDGIQSGFAIELNQTR